MTMSVRSIATLLCATGALSGFCAQATAANSAPKISGAAPSWVAPGSVYSFKPKSSDANGDSLTFRIANKPNWTWFDTRTGGLYGWPSTRSIGNYKNIVITVSDGKASTSLPAFSFTVSKSPPSGSTNRPPLISGSPAASVNVGAAYSFRPSASDPDGDGIAFTIANKPQWLSFNTTTGALTGTPLAANAGSYSNIAISVSDGKASTALAPFGVTVRTTSPPPATTGAATISWLPPTRNTDGSSLSNLAGYRIVYGTSAGALNQTVQLTNPSLSTYMIENLSVGTYYFALRAYTSSGAESVLSQVVSKNVR